MSKCATRLTLPHAAAARLRFFPRVQPEPAMQCSVAPGWIALNSACFAAHAAGLVCDSATTTLCGVRLCCATLRMTRGTSGQCLGAQGTATHTLSLPTTTSVAGSWATRRWSDDSSRVRLADLAREEGVGAGSSDGSSSATTSSSSFSSVDEHNQRRASTDAAVAAVLKAKGYSDDADAPPENKMSRSKRKKLARLASEREKKKHRRGSTRG